jgi:hypothetical protein
MGSVIMLHALRLVVAMHGCTGMVGGPPARQGSGAAQISWVSHPVRANATVMVSGSGFGAGKVQLRRAGSVPLDLVATHVSAAAAAFVLPPAAGVDYPHWSVSIDGSNELGINAPEVWWWQGDLGRDASVGGALHVFGRSVGAPLGTAAVSPHQRSEMKESLLDVLGRGDVAEAQRLAGRLAAQQLERLVTVSEALPSLRLHSVAGDQQTHTLRATPSAASSRFRATFPLPAAVSAGVYEAELVTPDSATEPLTMFTSPQNPRNSRIVVRLPTDHASKRIDVSQYCHVGVDCGIVNTNSSAPLMAALRDAAVASAAGAHTTIWLPRGQWYLNNTDGIVLPPNTTLRGEAMDLTAMYMPEQEKSDAPPLAYFHMAENSTSSAGGSSWGLQDLTVYITHYCAPLTRITTPSPDSNCCTADPTAYDCMQTMVSATADRRPTGLCYGGSGYEPTPSLCWACRLGTHLGAGRRTTRK